MVLLCHHNFRGTLSSGFVLANAHYDHCLISFALKIKIQFQELVINPIKCKVTTLLFFKLMVEGGGFTPLTAGESYCFGTGERVVRVQQIDLFYIH